MQKIQRFLLIKKCWKITGLESQWYGKNYREAKRDLVLSKDYYEKCYSSKYIRHFYDDADIEKFKSRWKRNIR